jgi:FtsP/CotA-like multicopper oxidase with cupredoxin domain
LLKELIVSNAFSKRPAHVGVRRVSRRGLMKYFAVTGGLAIATALPGFRGGLLAKGGSRGSPPTRPFVEPLPMAPVAKPSTATSFQPQPSRALPVDAHIYEIETREALHSFHPDLPPSSIWGYEGITPGPTFVAEANTTVVVRFKNGLPENDPVGIGLPINAIHRHGGFQAPEDDGHAADFFPCGASRDYVFFHPPEDSTLWYHDHSLDITAENVCRGLSGFYLIFDEKDSLAGELDPNPDAFRLPGRMVDGQRKYDIPLVFQDRLFDGRGLIAYDSFDHNGFIGDKFTVNGKIQPFFDVEPRKYRFRFLNGSNARQYEFVLRDAPGSKVNLPFDYVIGTDDRLLENPLPGIAAFRIAPAERVQVVIDFSKYAGKEIYLVNRLEQKEGRKPEGVVEPGTPIVKFRVGTGKVDDPSQVPASLRLIPADEKPEAVLARGVKVRREFKFNRQGGAWAINGQLYDENRIDAKPIEDEWEIWAFESGGGWEHPVHVHLSNFFIISRNGKAPPLLERGQKDTVVVGGKRGSVEVLIKFSGFTGRYLMHCHTTEHEDARMMLNFEVQPRRRA